MFTEVLSYTLDAVVGNMQGCTSISVSKKQVVIPTTIKFAVTAEHGLTNIHSCSQSCLVPHCMM